ncbi:MAG: elongation factor G [Gammaproteobacteria bacterium]|nr:elongation factor G [Gammaproteobacteria bacterium]
MPKYSSEEIRNIALVGHGGSGKTTLAEMLLLKAGSINEAGSVEKGTTVCDHDLQEQKLQHSLESALASMDFSGRHINLIDTPGLPDFIGRAISVLSAVETAAVVVDATAGIELTTQRMMEIGKERRQCRLVIVNKIDAQEADIQGLLEQLRESFGSECLPINLPAGGGERVEDCYFQPTGGETDFSSVEQAHTEIIDQVVEVDEELMELYLEQGEDIDPAQLHNPFEKALREGHLVPVCFVSAQTGAGIAELLDVFASLMPNPSEGNPPPFLKGEGDSAVPVTIESDPAKHVVAHVFKVAFDPFAGKLGLVRIHQGTVNPNSQLYIGNGRKPFKVSHLFQLQGKKHVEVGAGIPGDICALAKVDELHFDDVLHDSHDEDHFHLASTECPAPMFGLAIEIKRRGDEKKLSDVLHKLDQEDPCLLVEQNAVVNETVIRGLGDLHLRVVLEKMQERYGVEVDTHPPSIPHRETIGIKAEGHHRHKKQTGGAGQFGEVYLRVEPLERGSGFEFVNAVVGGTIPSGLIPAVEKGVRQVMDSGAIAGYPMQDIRVTVYDGKYHPVDSKEIAFVTAGKKAFLDAIQKAKPTVVEPVVDIRVYAPNENMGDVSGDLSGMRGRISGSTSLAGGRICIEGQVPLAELGNYQSRLKSITAGEGSYSIDFSHYAAMPAKAQQQLVAEFRPHEDEE